MGTEKETYPAVLTSHTSTFAINDNKVTIEMIKASVSDVMQTIQDIQNCPIPARKKDFLIEFSISVTLVERKKEK